MKIAVLGVGGTGGYFGGRLAANGHDVSFVARGANLAALQRDGLAVESAAGDFSVASVRATGDTRDVGEVDFVLLCVKTWQLAPAITALEPMVGAHTAIVTLQNGVEAPAEVAATFGQEAVLPGVAKIFASLTEPGRVSHAGGPASLVFAEWDNRPTARVERLRAALTESTVATAEPGDIWAELWAKFLFVVPFGGLGAAADAPAGALRSRPGTRRLLADAMREIESVGRAHGIRLPHGIVQTTMEFLDQQPSASTTSLQRDIVSGNPSELDSWTGAVVRLGVQSQTPTPIHSLLYELLSLREQHGR